MVDNPARAEMEAVTIYNGLVASGYKIVAGTSTWAATEPEERFLPQYGRAFQTIREVMKWAEACESLRFALQVEEDRRK